MSVVPPPLPIKIGTPVWKKYLFFGAMLGPALVFHVFNALVLDPKARKLWKDAGENVASAQWWMNINEYFIPLMQVSVVVLTCVIAALELYTRWWPRWRTGVLATMTLALNTFVLFEVSYTSATMGLAAPQAIKKAKQEVEKKAVQK